MSPAPTSPAATRSPSATIASLCATCPYIGGSGDLRWGTLAAKLVFVDQEQVTQDDHQVYFAGGRPYQLDGTPAANLGGGASTIQLAGG